MTAAFGVTLNEYNLRRIASYFTGMMKFSNSKVPVFAQDEPAEWFYLIKSGKCDIIRYIVLRSGVGNELESRIVHIDSLKAGTYFGENSLILRSTHSVTVLPSGPLECYVMPQNLFVECFQTKAGTSALVCLQQKMHTFPTPDEIRERCARQAKWQGYKEQVVVDVVRDAIERERTSSPSKSGSRPASEGAVTRRLSQGAIETLNRKGSSRRGSIASVSPMPVDIPTSVSRRASKTSKASEHYDNIDSEESDHSHDDDRPARPRKASLNRPRSGFRRVRHPTIMPMLDPTRAHVSEPDYDSIVRPLMEIGLVGHNTLSTQVQSHDRLVERYAVA